MYNFLLQRDKDISGVSGTGIIAEGVIFHNGKVVLAWLGQYKTIYVYDSVDEMMAIHGHNGATYMIKD